MDAMVKCRDCGLLGVRSRALRTLIEFTRDVVAEDGFYDDVDGGTYYAELECGASEYDLRAEDTDGRSALTVANTDRKCNRFVKRVPGRSPTEHQDMAWQQIAADAQSRLADIQGRIADLQSKALEWRELQADKNDRFAKQIQALEETRHQELLKVGQSQASGTNWQAISSILAVVVAVAGLLVSLAAYWKA